MIGQMLGHYRVVEKLGQGGMGVVYLAEDTQLGRRVALKLLPEEFAAQRDRLQRFLSEAKLSSSFNHPNIVSVYELGEYAGQPYIAMEYVAGKSLRAALQAGSLPLKKLLDLALPAAEALARAHRAGVIHRDIKPENLLVSEDGYIKVADFGLAKLKPTHTGDATITDLGPTASGQVVGTAPYMSPEQLQGQEVDGRSDVFAFGAVLYEMATGRSPFRRDSAADTSAAILRDSPKPVRALSAEAPAELERIIGKALEKEPDFRYHTMDDLVTDLKRLRRDLEAGRLAAPETPPAAGPTPRAWWKPALLVGAIAAAVVLAIVFKIIPVGGPGGAPALTRSIQLTTLPGLEDSPTWSPDGRSLAYVSDATGNLDIYVQQIAGGPAIRVTDSEADDAQPAWSPDGSRIAFVSARAHPEKRLSILLNIGILGPFCVGRNGDVWVMPALGGAARRVAQNAYSPAWSPDGKQLVYQALHEGRWDLWIREVDTPGEPRALGLTRMELPAPVLFRDLQIVVMQPAWSPDGKWIAFAAGVGTNVRVYAVPVERGDPVALTEPGVSAFTPSWSSDGRWLFFSSDRGGKPNLWKARFDDGRLGPLQQVTTAASASDVEPRQDPTGKRLAYGSVQLSSDLWQYNLKTRQATRLTTETTLEDYGRPSPDGRWLAFTSDRMNELHVWLMDRQTGELTQVTTGGDPVTGWLNWSRDGKQLYYTAGGVVYRYEPLTGNAQKVFEGIDRIGMCVSADDRYLVLGQDQMPAGLVRVELASGKKELLVADGDFTPADPSCSPDGKWVAFFMQRGNERKVWVVPFAGGEARQLTFGEGEDSHPTWSPDSRTVYFLRNHQDLYAAAVNGREPQLVFRAPSFSVAFDYPAVSRDGQYLFYTRSDKVGDLFLLELSGE